MATLDEIKTFARELSPLAHLATIDGDGRPHVVPIHPAWEGDTLWAMIDTGSKKARNVTGNPHVAMHWQVSEAGDGVELWGTAEVVGDLETKRRLWEGVFDYDLNLFAPDGPDSPATSFLKVTPEKALLLKFYGINGKDTWHR